MQEIDFIPSSLREEIPEVLGGFIRHVTSVKEKNCAFERLIGERFVSQKIESPKVICSPDWHEDVRNIGPMVSQIDKKRIRPREVQLRL
jgi:hypothetical protein